MADEFFAMAPEPKTLLGRHRTLSPTAGIKVSPIVLGTMGFGSADRAMMGDTDKATAFQVMDSFREHGGNFMDTSNNYQAQESERWIGEWLTSRKCRAEMVIATKFTLNYRAAQREGHEIPSSFMGNNSKSLRNSLANSLVNLQTDYVDILYVHMWDFSTSIPELMHSLNREINNGRVLYLGISDTPAWVVAKANQYARDHGLQPFSIYQGLWNVAARDMEREIIPLCIDDGMAIAPWRALGGGAFKTDAEKASGEGRQQMLDMCGESRMLGTLTALAEKRKTKVTSIALAFVMASAPDVFPILGMRKLSYLVDAMEALKIRLTQDELEHLRGASAFDPGFPMNFLQPGKSSTMDSNVADSIVTRSQVRMDVGAHRQPAFAPQAK